MSLSRSQRHDTSCPPADDVANMTPTQADWSTKTETDDSYSTPEASDAGGAVGEHDALAGGGTINSWGVSLANLLKGFLGVIILCVFCYASFLFFWAIHIGCESYIRDYYADVYQCTTKGDCCLSNGAIKTLSRPDATGAPTSLCVAIVYFNHKMLLRLVSCAAKIVEVLVDCLV